MSARHGQGIATWLIMFPLLIVPLIAVFGVPQISPISTQTADGANADEPGLSLELGSDAPLEASIPPFPGATIDSAPSSSGALNPSNPDSASWSDPFENPTVLAPSTPPPGNSDADPFNPPAAPATPAPRDDFWARPDSRMPDPNAGIDEYSRHPAPGETPHQNPPPRTEPAPQLTWREAVARLNQLGVQKFQLSQTEEPFVFQFVCDLSRPDNPRVTHRFDAKAGEPLKAVENVIQQVETWSAQQAQLPH